jgi:heme exporter protein B
MANPSFEVARKDLLVEGRGREALGLMAVLAALVVIVMRLAFDASRLSAPPSAVLWVTLVFITAAGLARTFHSESEHGTLDLLLASPASPAALYGAKFLSGLAVALAGGLLALVLTGLFFGGAPLSAWGPLSAFLVLGAAGLAAQSAFVSALSARSRARTALFPVLYLPLAAPLMYWVVRGTEAAGVATTSAGAEVVLDLGLVAAYDVLTLAVYFLLAPWALED